MPRVLSPEQPYSCCLLSGVGIKVTTAICLESFAEPSDCSRANQQSHSSAIPPHGQAFSLFTNFSQWAVCGGVGWVGASKAIFMVHSAAVKNTELHGEKMILSPTF